MYSLADWQVVAGGCWLSPDEHKQCPPHTNFLVITCQVKSSRYLGIHLNYPLSWNDHTGNLSFPLQQRLYFFYFLRRLKVSEYTRQLMKYETLWLWQLMCTGKI